MFNRQVAKQALRQTASDSRGKLYREKLLKVLKRFSKPSKLEIGPGSSELRAKEVRQSTHDYKAYIMPLYSTLACHCRCPIDGPQKHIAANLRLKNCCIPGEDDSVKFRLFFLDHPHDAAAGEACHWQDTEISVLRKKSVSHMYQFERFFWLIVCIRRVETEKNLNKTTRFRSGHAMSTDTFCEVITNRNRAQLKFCAMENGLILQGPGRLSQDFVLDSSSVSLGALLKVQKLSQKMRLLLAYFVAKAVWQFYGSEWMQTEWTKNSVHFMFERPSVGPEGISINEPFLSARFDGHRSLGSTNNQYRSHCFPEILSLGIMLTEIELNIHIEDYRFPQDVRDDGEARVNADHFAVHEVFNQTELWERRETFSAYRDVVQACIVPDDFTAFIEDLEGLRDALDKHVVSPLEVLCRMTWGQPDTSEVRLLEVKFPKEKIDNYDHQRTIPTVSTTPVPDAIDRPAPAAYHLPHHSISLQKSALNYKTPQFSSSLPSSTMAVEVGITSEIWFQQLDRLNSALRVKPPENDNLYHTTKVAILDTGIHDNYADQIKDYKDFVSGNDEDYRDNTNHGTTAVRLVQRVYNKADIYIARVFDTSVATPQTPQLMALAIEHATKTWQVDVIIIASGFDAASPALETAIDDARHARILIFAAASNYGNVHNIAFPARLYIDLKLFCMFSTDAHVRAHPRFNPSPIAAARHNFAILGDAIIVPGAEQSLSGTSFAAMIGGAFAARLIDFSRQKDTRGKIRGLEKLQTVEGMSAVFREVATRDSVYHCVRPWGLLRPSGEREDEDGGTRRRAERTYVCETMSRCLENMHSNIGR